MGNSLTKVGVVIGHGDAGSFDESRVESLTVITCPENGRLAGVYTGYAGSGVTEAASIGLAWSDDGVTWEKAGQLLAGTGVAGDPDKGGCTGPLLVLDGGLYHLFYIGLTEGGYEGGTKTVCLATSPSLVDPVWTRRGTVMGRGVTSNASIWRAAAVWHPSIVRAGGKWYCFINASGLLNVGESSRERIGYATADSLLGPWTFDDANSPLISTPDPYWISGDPAVTKIPGGWRMDFFRAISGGTAFELYATTTDEKFPLGWEIANGGAAILAPSEVYDAKYAHKPGILKHGGRVFHYYTAVAADDARTIALATDPRIGPDLSGALPVTGSTTAARVAAIEKMLRALGLPVSGDDPFVSDDFDRADGDPGTTPVGSKVWATSGGAGWAISGGQLVWSGTSDGLLGVNLGRADNWEIEFTLATVAGTYPVALFWGSAVATASTSKLFRNQASNFWRIINNTAGAGSAVDFTVARDLVSGDVVRLRKQYTTYTLFINGAQAAKWNDFTYNNTAADTYVGIVGSASTALVVSAFAAYAI